MFWFHQIWSDERRWETSATLMAKCTRQGAVHEQELEGHKRQGLRLWCLVASVVHACAVIGKISLCQKFQGSNCRQIVEMRWVSRRQANAYCRPRQSSNPSKPHINWRIRFEDCIVDISLSNTLGLATAENKGCRPGNPWQMFFLVAITLRDQAGHLTTDKERLAKRDSSRWSKTI